MRTQASEATRNANGGKTIQERVEDCKAWMSYYRRLDKESKMSEKAKAKAMTTKRTRGTLNGMIQDFKLLVEVATDKKRKKFLNSHLVVFELENEVKVLKYERRTLYFYINRELKYLCDYRGMVQFGSAELEA